eukprot:scaffold1140_cov251-Pinguiococcus_pyrenoidosus.AAC.1
MKASGDAFDYRVLRNDAGLVVGFAYQTGRMRYALTNYAQFMSLDARKTRSCLEYWPFFAPVVFSGSMRAEIVVEGFCVTESKEAYKFFIEAAFDMAPAADRRDTRIVFSDGILHSLEGFNLPCASWFLDTFHLLQFDCRKLLGVVAPPEAVRTTPAWPEEHARNGRPRTGTCRRVVEPIRVA